MSTAVAVSAAALGEYLGPSAPLPGDGVHLPECPHRGGSPTEPCDWCQWAIQTPELETLLAVGRDTRALLGWGSLDSVAAVVAFARLEELAASVNLESVWVSSSRRLVDATRQAVAVDLDRLRHRIARAVAAGGPIEVTCLRAAGGLAVVALQTERGRDAGSRLPESLRDRIDQLTRNLSVEHQIATFLHAVEALHHTELPPLATQPEWDRRPPAAAGPAGLAGRQLAAANVEPGSLEALVVESLLAETTDLLVSLGEELGDIGPPVTLRRPTTDEPHSPTARSLVWRVSRLDWHLTFVDTHHAHCWGARTEGGTDLVDVPAAVALAIEVSLAAGLVSGIYPTPPGGLALD